MAMYTKENLAQVEKLFGAPLGHFPEIFPGWDGPKGTAFWASNRYWNTMMLQSENSCAFMRFPGPNRKETAPFTVKPKEDGYLIFVPDEDPQ